MRFEGEEAPEQRFTGTIVGTEDGDPKRWKDSKWRCLKVRWDEASTIPRPERVSPWKIEPALTPPALNPLPMPRPKRPRLNIVSPSPDSSVLTREATVDPSPTSGFSRVLQGQEFSTLRANFTESNEPEIVEKPIAWQPSVDDEKNDVVSASQRYRSENWMHLIFFFFFNFFLGSGHDLLLLLFSSIFVKFVKFPQLCCEISQHNCTVKLCNFTT